jgi:hypothetical protein
VGCEHSHCYCNMSHIISHYTMSGIISLCSCMYVLLYLQRIKENIEIRLYYQGEVCVFRIQQEKVFDVAIVSISLYLLCRHIRTILFHVIFLFIHSVLVSLVWGLNSERAGPKFIYKDTLLSFRCLF